MARKKPRKAKVLSKARVQKEVNAGDLASSASAHFDQCRYKEAMTAYKRLLEQEPENAQWLERLLQCYQLRALELSNKGMHREAAVIWENYKGRAPQHFAQNSENLEAYINCLLSTRQFEKIAVLYQEQESVALQLSCCSRAFSYLALQLLVGDKNCEKHLQVTAKANAESSVSKLLHHRDCAWTALQAFCGKDDRLLEESLGKIPFRSPYRDLAQILKALRANESAPGAESLQPLRRIKPDSAFYSLAHTLFDCCQSPRRAIDILASQPPGRQVLLCELLGLPKDTLKVLRRAKPCLEHRQPKALLEFLLTNQQLLPKVERQALCWDLLPYHPKGYKSYAKQFGALSRSQLHLLEVRAGRENNNAEQEYEALLDWVEEGIDFEPQALAAAIYRRLAELAGKLEFEFWDLPIPQIEALEASLKFDDTHKPGYFRLIELYARENSPRQRQHWIDKAIQRFPDDRDFLTLAIGAAVDKGTYKKAVGLAKTLLKTDPLNQQAKSALVASHLSHARKQLRAGKYHLVNKELEGALAVETRHHRHNIVMLQALLAHRQGEFERAGKVFAQWTAKSDNSLFDRVVLHWEALTVYGSQARKKAGEAAAVSESIAEYGGGKNKTPAANAIPECIRFLRGAQKWDAEAVRSTVEHHAKELNGAGKALRDYNDLLLCCEFFYEIRAYGLLKDYSGFAAKAHAKDPLFAFYSIWAKARGDCFRLAGKDVDRLHVLMEQAEEGGQERLKTMIVDFLHNDRPFIPAPRSRPEPQLEHMGHLMEVIESLLLGTPAESERILASLAPDERQMLEEMLELLPPELDQLPLPNEKKQRRKKSRGGKGNSRSRQLPLEY